MKRLTLLFLVLAFVGTADADESFYEYGMRILLSPPLTITGSGSATWKVQVPEFSFVGQVYVKNCKLLGIDTPMEFDEHITLYQSGANFSHGGYTFVIGDRKPGRSQTFCLRLPFVPLEDKTEP